MDIVDAQVHSNVLGGPQTVLAIMDAIGIRAVLIDEYLGIDEDGSLRPAYKTPRGISRPIGPNAEAAAVAYPDRFQYLMRIDPLDPDLEPWIDALASSPNLRALRVTVFGEQAGAAFEAGAFEPAFRAAKTRELPLFVTCPRRARHLVPYARKFPDLQLIIDHCGVAFDMPTGQASLDDAVALGECANIAFKWAHAPTLLSVEPYPFPDLDAKLRQVVDAFGRERVMWASDYTVSRQRQSWAEALFCLRHSPALSETDKEWVLGRTVRTLLRWPAPEKPAELPTLHAHRVAQFR